MNNAQRARLIIHEAKKILESSVKVDSLTNEIVDIIDKDAFALSSAIIQAAKELEQHYGN